MTSRKRNAGRKLFGAIHTEETIAVFLANNVHSYVRVMNFSRNKSCKTNQFACAHCGGRGICPTSSPDSAIDQHLAGTDHQQEGEPTYE